MSDAPCRAVSIVTPTYREADNLPHLIERLEALRAAADLDIELLIMDDDSPDGTPEVIAKLARPWVRLVTRTSDRGLSQAVLHGLQLARCDVVVVMDADLSHPPESVPAMLAALAAGADFVIGSRYVAGGKTDDDWGLFRWLNSKVATLLARPYTDAKDPMAGFFAMRRADLARAPYLNPIGYKIGLELIVKCGLTRVAEVPIHFADRERGQSKMNLAEQLRYLQHLRRLFIFKYPGWSYVIQFAVVGGLGTIVNLLTLTLLLAAGLPFSGAVALAIAVAMTFNFGLNRRFTFSYAKNGALLRQFVGFCGACSVGAVANFATAVVFFRLAPPSLQVEQLAALCGIAVGMGFNYVINRHLVFRKSRRPASTEPEQAT